MIKAVYVDLYEDKDNRYPITERSVYKMNYYPVGESNFIPISVEVGLEEEFLDTLSLLSMRACDIWAYMSNITVDELDNDKEFVQERVQGLLSLWVVAAMRLLGFRAYCMLEPETDKLSDKCIHVNNVIIKVLLAIKEPQYMSRLQNTILNLNNLEKSLTEVSKLEQHLIEDTGNGMYVQWEGI